MRNAIYKVICAASPDELGQKIVVQGGTFCNDAVLRSFETLLGRHVIRPAIAGLMGAYGAALYAKTARKEASSLLDRAQVESFTYRSTAAVCGGCGNHCHLTINFFREEEKYVSGAKCDRGAGITGKTREELPNLYRFKAERLASLFEAPAPENARGTIGLPAALGMIELAPFWHALFTSLNIRVIFSGFSSRELYTLGQYSIPSDTACYPAKLMHGHIETLIREKPDAIFYPCLTYNVDEKIADNHFNCPVVAYYSELLSGNMESLGSIPFLYPYLHINDPKTLAKQIHEMVEGRFGHFTLSEVRRAVAAANQAYDKWMADTRAAGERLPSRQRSASSISGPITRGFTTPQSMRRHSRTPSLCSSFPSDAGSTPSQRMRCVPFLKRTASCIHKSKSMKSPISAPSPFACAACSARWSLPPARRKEALYDGIQPL